MTGAFIGRRRDRLGARLLMLLNCMRLSADYGVPFKLDWFPPGADAPELDKPEELFSADWIAEHMVHASDHGIEGQSEASLWEFRSDRSPDRLIARLASGCNIAVDEGFLIAVLPWEDPDDVRAKHTAMIGEVGFNAVITGHMDRIESRLAGRRFTAYHLRRGDIIDRPPWTHKAWPAKIEIDELYKVHMEKAEGQIGIVFTDTPASLDGLAAHAEEAVGIDTILDLDGLTAAQRDLLELYTMSRADQIVAPSISAFSSAAARIAGKERVMFRDVLTEDEFASAYDQLADRMARAPHGFPSLSDAAHHYSRLHSQLTADGRIREAWSLGRTLQRLSCDRAFLPILLALNEFYLRQWKESETIARQGLSHPDLWPEDHAVLTAILAGALAAQGKRAVASKTFARAFWAKPTRPDVAVIGSRLLYRDSLNTEDYPPIDWELLARVRRPWYPPFINLSLVQHRVIRRRPVNFDLVVMDWSELSLDSRARRLFSDHDRLDLLRRGLLKADPEGEHQPGVASALAAVELRLRISDKASCIARSEGAVVAKPDDLLLRKRHADLLEATGDVAAARCQYEEIVEEAPNDAHLTFAYGQFLIRNDEVEAGEAHVLAAAAKAPRAAAIHGEAGRILLRLGAPSEALPQLQIARRLCPSYGRFENQIARIEEKLSKATAQKLPV
jgi:tetratricopeptide (TPR) repeat protein